MLTNETLDQDIAFYTTATDICSNIVVTLSHTLGTLDDRTKAAEQVLRHMRLSLVLAETLRSMPYTSRSSFHSAWTGWTK